MNIYIDTEFNSFRGPLMSVALVDETGRAFYAVLPPPTGDELDPWVRANVVPVLGQASEPLYQVQSRMESFLLAYESIHVVADYPTDLLHFCWLLETLPGERIATPPLTMGVYRHLNTSASVVPHNALADAQALRLMASSRGL